MVKNVNGVGMVGRWARSSQSPHIECFWNVHVMNEHGEWVTVASCLARPAADQLARMLRDMPGGAYEVSLLGVVRFKRSSSVV